MDSAAIFVALVSVLLKETAFQVTRRIAERVGSQVLIANAWHHRSDAIAAFVALVGVIGAVAGFSWLDVAAGLVLSAFVFKAGWDVGKDATLALVDASRAVDVENIVGDAAFETLGKGAKRPTVADLRARKVGPKTHVDIWLEMDPAAQTSLGEAMRVMDAFRVATRRRLRNEAGEVTIQVRWKETEHSGTPFLYPHT
jgi:cation diffusion facilitator family transporter